MFDRTAIAWAIYHSGTPENLRELTEYGNAGPIADAVIAALNDAMHKSGVSNRPLNADALAAPAPSCAPGEVERLTQVVLREAREEGADSPVDYGDAEQIVKAILAALSPQGLDAKEGEQVKSWEPIASAPRDRQIIRVLVPLKDGGFIEGAAYFDPDAYDGTWWWDGTSNADYFTDPISECNHGDPLYWLPDSNTGEQASSLGIMTDQPVSIAATRHATPSQRLDAATVERLRIEREGYRQIAISEGWSWALERAYGREEYLRQRIAEVDSRLANRIEKGWDREAALSTKPHQHGGKGA